MEKYRVRIIDIIEESPNVRTYYLEKPEGLTWVEASHSHIALEGFDSGEKPNKDWVRHMSIITLPEENKVGFTTGFSGVCSEFKQKLKELTVGDAMVLFKIGSRVFLRREDRPLVLLSMGVGIATMRPLILKYAEEPHGISELLNINVDSSQRFVFRKELDLLQSDHYTNLWTSSRREFYDTLRSLNLSAEAYYYVIGSDEFIMGLIQILRERGIDDSRILIDKKEEHMQEYFK